MRRILLMPMLALPLLLGGCLAKTAVSLATVPVKAGAQAADWATTSRDEADRNYGRRHRKQEEREARERRKAERRCRADPQDCETVR
jgi:hypothetical protein